MNRRWRKENWHFLFVSELLLLRSLRFCTFAVKVFASLISF